MRRLFIIALLVIILPTTVLAKNLSPLNFGLEKARTGIERYEILLRCHQKAVQQGCGVTYKGIDSLYIEIPYGAIGIPLTDSTDFANAVITVKNNAQDVYLYTMIRPVEKIQLKAQQVDKGIFENVEKLNKGDYIVILTDANPWVDDRIGYGYPHYRRDVLLVHNGKAVNSVIMPYDNEWSKVECSYRPVKKKQKVFCNLVFHRDERSSYKTCLLRVVAEHNVVAKNIKVKTPSDDELFGDHVFMVEDCTNFTLEDVEVDGTYSQIKKYGYAFGLNNVWGHKAIRVKADGKWGVYGNNNVSEATLADCVINRFDIHSYGRDIKCKGCYFFRLYNAFGGTYGDVKYDRCVFDESIPFMDGGSYNTFVPLNVVFKGCLIIMRKKEPWIIQYLKLPKNVNRRPELSERFLPNVIIKNSIIQLSGNEKKWYVYRAPSIQSNQFKGGEVTLVKNKIGDGTSVMEKCLLR